jgi:hypothetical protein
VSIRTFRPDDRVSHVTYGAGVVVDINERYTVIAFDDGGLRKFVTTLVQLEGSTLPLPVKPAPRRRRPTPRRKTGAGELSGRNEP